jgi:hypothetical protein
LNWSDPFSLFSKKAGAESGLLLDLKAVDEKYGATIVDQAIAVVIDTVAKTLLRCIFLLHARQTRPDFQSLVFAGIRVK